MAVIGDYGNRLAIVARQHALNRAAPVRLEGDPLANPELEHVSMSAHVLQQTKALDDPMVEVDQFGFRQPVNVDHYEASPSALNGVSTLQRPTGTRKPPNARLERFIPHSAVLPLAAAMVTQCGLGTVSKALLHGVPLVCLLLLGDQPENAARVAVRGAGLRLPAEAAPDRIAEAIRRV